MQRRRIGIVVYDGVSAINLAGPVEAFSVANAEQQETLQATSYEVLTIGCTGRRFRTDSGLAMESDVGTDERLEIDTLIVPGGTGLANHETATAIAQWVVANHAAIRRIASVCTGIRALALTGLFDGRRVTTHWKRAREIATSFPELRVEESALFIRDGRFYSSAGATAGIDLSLALIAEDCGRDVSVHVAQRLLVYVQRDGGQEQYAAPEVLRITKREADAEVNVDRMDNVIRWIRSNLGDQLRIETLAAQARLSKNDFIVRFKETYGSPPALFIKNLRFNEARRKLGKGESPALVARTLGFKDPNYFRQEFRRRFGGLPDEYQRRFGRPPATDPHARESTRVSTLAPYCRPRVVSFTRGIRRHVAAGENGATRIRQRPIAAE